MIVRKSFNVFGIFKMTRHHILWLTVWVSAVAFLIEYTHWTWLSIPWLPLSVIATAVAFYVGFKNNQAYERLWEARKIWGSIVNNSRSWGSATNSFITNHFRKNDLPESELKALKKDLIYRHIAWLYTLRQMLLIPTAWEHVSQSRFIARHAERSMELYGIGTVDNDEISKNVKNLLSSSEIREVESKSNPATHLLDNQYKELTKLHAEGLIDDFRHLRMEKILSDFYTYQGQCERIKKFPLPRQYGSMSFVFVAIFIFLLPFGMVSEFSKLGDWGLWLSIPSSILVGWVYLVMELVGDYSENPFEGLPNDIPMLSICRTIEIDLRQMLDEKDIPSPIEVKNGILM